jgi:hypothetical protein
MVAFVIEYLTFRFCFQSIKNNIGKLGYVCTAQQFWCIRQDITFQNGTGQFSEGYAWGIGGMSGWVISWMVPSSTERLLVKGTKTRQMHAGSLPVQSPSCGSGDRRAVYDYKNVRNTYQITINVENDLNPLAHTPDTAVQGL